MIGAARYFAPRYWAARYWAKLGAPLTPAPEPEPHATILVSAIARTITVAAIEHAVLVPDIIRTIRVSERES